MVGGRGRDKVFGGPGSDKLYGDFVVATSRRASGRRGDRIHGGDGNDQSFGGAGRDKMSGGKGDDVQYGGAGRDVIFANRGVDTSFGGDGNDTLWALAKSDVTAPGDLIGDTLVGGNGNDTFRVRDGEVDKVTCGDGSHDRLFADQYDVITDPTAADPTGSCELVERKDATTQSAVDEDKTESSGQDSKEG